MGASESKLVFKQGIFRLAEEQAIPADDPYWQGFWELPDSVEDVFSLFSPADIRRTRDMSMGNLETLILVITSRLNVLRAHPSFPDLELAPPRDALNCIRVLTRLLPFIYEADQLSEWEEKFFWGVRRKRIRREQLPGEVIFDEAQNNDDQPLRGKEDDFEEARPLAEEIIDTLSDLLFFTGFTIPRLPTAKSKVTYAIWQSGVGCKTSLGSSKELESNRCEVLRLLLTLTSKSIYLSSSILPVQGVKAITYITTCPDKQVVLSILCSLLNTTIKYNAATWRLPYDHVVWKDPKQALVIYSIQLLLVLLLYPVPENGTGPPPKNYYRHFLGRLHRPEDFQFLADGMARILSQPMQATTSYLLGSQKSVKWAPEMLMLFWETLQCNKRFRSFIVQSNRAHDFMILCLFYAIEHKADSSKQGLVRMCVFILQTMSVEPTFGKNLNKTFEAQETLPPVIRISNFCGTYADFLLNSIHTLITGSKGKLDAIYAALLAIINNIAPYATNLDATTSSKILQLFSSMSAPSFLLANETNHALLHSLLESINAILEHQYKGNPNLIYAVLKSRKRVEALRVFTLESGQEEIERMNRRRKEILNSSSDAASSTSRPSSTDHPARSTPSRSNSTALTNVPEEDGPFAVGDSEDSDDDHPNQPTPSQSSRASRTPSIGSSADDTVIQLRGMSEKARGKLPAGSSAFSRQSSGSSDFPTTHSSLSRTSTATTALHSDFTPTTPWLESWLPDLPLHTLLTLLRTLSPHFPPTTATSTILADLPATATHPSIAPLLASPTSPLLHTFSWSPLSLGWYASVLWSCIFAAEMLVSDSNSSAAGLSGNTTATPGAVGVWNGTAVKLFQVQEARREGPTLMKPKGAVDAVGSRLVQGVQGLRIGAQRAVSGGGGAQSVREV